MMASSKSAKNSALVTRRFINKQSDYPGGGHEVAWASFQGLVEHLHKAKHLNKIQSEYNPKIGIVNFDAHFDLREFESDIANVKPSSGTLQSDQRLPPQASVAVLLRLSWCECSQQYQSTVQQSRSTACGMNTTAI